MTVGHSVRVFSGYEGGFAPNLRSNTEPLDLILEAINAAGYEPGEQIALALDPAASEFFENGKYIFAKSDGSTKSSEEMIRFFDDWLRQYPIVSLEDGWSEHDWDGWKLATKELGKKVQLVADDIFVTNPEIIRRGIREGVANSVLIKLNQIGTVTETFKAIETARDAGYTCVCSHRSGETEDTFLVDFTVASGVGQIKTGSLKEAVEDALAFERGERRNLHVTRIQAPGPAKDRMEAIEGISRNEKLFERAHVRTAIHLGPM